jgi:hypothetical protein
MEEHDDIRLIGVAGRHPHLPPDPWMPDVPIAYLPIAAPWLYQTWLRVGWPKVERATGPVEVTHATGLIPCPTDAPLVVTLHDLAFVHEPAHFSKHGVRTFMRSLDHIRRHAAMVLCSSQAPSTTCRSPGSATTACGWCRSASTSSVSLPRRSRASVRSTGCPSAICCSSAPSNPARTCAAWPRPCRCSTNRCR